MSIITLILVLVLIGVILWAVNKYVPMDPKIRQILNIVIVIAVILWLLGVFGLLPALGTIRVGK